MKKLLYLFLTVLIVACSSDDGNNSNDGDNNNLFNCDGNPIQSIVYGTQEWTIENACNITYRDGTPIPEVTDTTDWNNLTTGAWCYYNNDPRKARLYNWYAVMGIHDEDPNTPNKEFTPEGWHVPSDDEWTTLEEYLISNGYNYDGSSYNCSPCSEEQNKIAKSMASNTGWALLDWPEPNPAAIGYYQSTNNSSGFSALPDGYRSTYASSFSGLFFDAGFWSSTENNTNNNAWMSSLGYSNPALLRLNKDTRFGFSVRFVRD